MLNVSWDDVYAYATRAGKHLPAEAEWERSVLGGGRDEDPWGKSMAPGTAHFDNI